MMNMPNIKRLTVTDSYGIFSLYQRQKTLGTQVALSRGDDPRKLVAGG